LSCTLTAKRARDKIKEDNTRLRQQAGLAGDELLLRDMEETVDTAADLRARVEVRGRGTRMHSRALCFC
jgi:hypothetical protein